ncbi:MAG: hypothetical protein V4731_06295 [Pseudomonadota bacterium]
MDLSERRRLPVLAFAPKSSHAAWGAQLVGMVAKIDNYGVLTGSLGDDELPRFTQSVELLKTRDIRLVLGRFDLETIIEELTVKSSPTKNLAVVIDEGCITERVDASARARLAKVCLMFEGPLILVTDSDAHLRRLLK